MYMRKTFKDVVAQDTLTFMNPTEFGEYKSVNQKPTVVMLDDDELEKRNLSRMNNNDVDRLAISAVLFYIKKEHFANRPQPNKMMEFDGHNYRINTVSEDMGIYTIELARHTG